MLTKEASNILIVTPRLEMNIESRRSPIDMGDSFTFVPQVRNDGNKLIKSLSLFLHPSQQRTTSIPVFPILIVQRIHFFDAPVNAFFVSPLE